MNKIRSIRISKARNVRWVTVAFDRLGAHRTYRPLQDSLWRLEDTLENTTIKKHSIALEPESILIQYFV